MNSKKKTLQNNHISVQKCRVHNLKNISVEIPKNTLTIISGPSGSGKSSLAFDTIYIEGQRRYIESLSSYARQFLGEFNPPDVDSITGLSPAVAIDQKTINRNPRSTVGTVTEIYDYFRILFARLGKLYSPTTKKLITKYTPISLANKLFEEYPENQKIMILLPLLANSSKELLGQLQRFLSLGISRAYLEKEGEKEEKIVELDKNFFDFVLKNKLIKINLIFDRLILKESSRKRLIEDIEFCFKEPQGLVIICSDNILETYSQMPLDFSENSTSWQVAPELSPQLFSFNSPVGACTECNGLGEKKEFSLDLLLEKKDLPLLEGAIPLVNGRNSFLVQMISSIAKQEKISLSVPFKKLSTQHQKLFLYGGEKVYHYDFTSENSHFRFSKPFSGIIPWLKKRFEETESEKRRFDFEKYMTITTCDLCQGSRLNIWARHVLVGEKSLEQLCRLSIKDLSLFMNSLIFKGEEKKISEKLIKEITSRLFFLQDVGLSYLNLERRSSTLSGGEAQRIRLASQIGSGLTGVIYVLDEPSIGLHQRDNQKLIKTLKHLRDLGNSVLVVEHDEETIREADYLIDLGESGGHLGGNIVFSGAAQEIPKGKGLTCDYLNGKKRIEIPQKRKKSEEFLILEGAKQNNLKNITLKLPLEGLVGISGVSGSGKSSLIHQVLIPAIKYALNPSLYSHYKKENFLTLQGITFIESLIELDQSPIGKTPHSNPATYTGLFTDIRDLFAKLPDSTMRGYLAGRFSFNVKGGRCEECEGNGVKKIEMHFLPDVFVTCTECQGRRYNSETLSIKFKEKNIAEILNLSISEAREFFSNHPKILRSLETLEGVGLGHMKLGQSATTLSGGEAQRLKLSRELSKRPKGKCLYILDEPTTGLHLNDIKVLLKALQKLIDQGHCVVVIEHNLDVLKSVDYLIDMGPEGGDLGGYIVAQGTPEEVSKCSQSHTGKFLKKILADS